jgi:hypothetical protein
MNQVWTLVLTGLAMVFLRGTTAAVVGNGDDETGVVSLTSDLHRSLFYGKQKVVESVKAEAHLYRAIKAIDFDIIFNPPKDCWKLFSIFMQQNTAIFKQWANKNCRNFIGCWCCPNGGLCITFFVPPDSPPCKFKEIAYATELKTHEF